jgi:hypothetical protein
VIFRIVGVWKGRVTESDHEDEVGSYEVTLSVSGGNPNGTVGMVYYSFDKMPPRRGRNIAMLTLTADASDRVVLKESSYLIRGQAIPCTFTLMDAPNGDLIYSFVNGSRSGGGTLSRMP